MKKKDLVSIIRKIQNRCCLEDPVKITYYFDDDRNVIFKIYFESLYLPEKFRLDTEDVQNMFTPSNVYDYEDDFRILDLNQDEGYVAILPDCQNFKVVDSYNASNKLSLNTKNENVCLAGKRLNEDFAKASGYILYESADPSTLQNASDVAKAAEQKAEEEKPKTPINLVIIGVTCPVTKNGIATFKKALDVCYGKSSGPEMAAIKGAFKNQEAKLKVAVTVPYIDGKVVPSFAFCSVKNFATEILDRTGETYTYVAASGNNHFADLINSSEIAQVAYITTTAKQGIKDNNFPAILAAEEVELNDGGDVEVVEDKTLDDYKKLEEIIVPQISKIGDLRDLNASKEQVQYYDKVKNEAYVKNIVSLYKDFYPRTKFEALKQYSNKRQDVVNKIVAGIANPTSGIGELSKWDATMATAEGSIKKGLLGALGGVEGGVFDRSTEKGDNNKVSSGMFSGMEYAGGKSAASVNKAPTKVEPKDKKAAKATYSDAEVVLLIDKKAKGLTEQAQKIRNELLDENVDFGTEPATEESKEDLEKEKKDQNQETNDQNADEAGKDQKSDNATDAKGDTAETGQNESVKGNAYRRLKEIFEG